MNSQQTTLESMSQGVWYNRWTLNKFSKFLHGDILEIGCGIGNFTHFLAAFGNVWAIDIDEGYIEKTRQKLNGQAKVGIGDIEKGKYFFGIRQFDVIVCLNVLEHIKRDEQAIKNIYKLVAAGGYLILLVPAHRLLLNSIDRSIGHFRRYEKDKLKNLLQENNFRIIKSKQLNFLGSIGWFVAGKFFKERVVSDMKIKIFNFISPPFLLLENIFEPSIGTSILIVAQKQ